MSDFLDRILRFFNRFRCSICKQVFNGRKNIAFTIIGILCRECYSKKAQELYEGLTERKEPTRLRPKCWNCDSRVYVRNPHTGKRELCRVCSYPAIEKGSGHNEKEV